MRQQSWSAKFVVLLARSVISRMAVPSSSSSWISGGSPVSGFTCSFVGFSRNWLNPLPTKLAKNVETQVRSLPSVQRSQVLRLKAASSSLGSAQEHMSYNLKDVGEIDGGQDLFVEMKQRFLNFKKQKYIKESDYFQTIAEAQCPKFMVIACADSRVCPSNILGFQPGEAFMIRNVANLVPPLENGPSETNAALEFAVNTLEVENILVIGHSSCGGIQALMSMQDDADSKSFLYKWVVNAKAAKLRAEADAAHYSFDQQCRHCEKGYILTSVIDGKIQMKSYLIGNPEIRLAFNDDLGIGRDGRSVYDYRSSSGSGAVIFDDCNFHESVRLDSFDMEKTLSLVPPDGEFTVTNYRMTQEFKPPFRITTLIEEAGALKAEVIIKVHAEFP